MPTGSVIATNTIGTALLVCCKANTLAGALASTTSGGMTRIPKGADLILNKVSGTPGFWIGNVIVMAGVPSIMQAMLDEVAATGIASRTTKTC
jgi:molybdopterin-biosynthesis enzyme MoeA-like protein